MNLLKNSGCILILISAVSFQLFQTGFCAEKNDVVSLPGFLMWLSKYGSKKFLSTISPSVVTASPILTPKPNYYHDAGETLLCGMTRYSESDALSSPNTQPYSGPARPNESPWLARIVDGTSYRWTCDGVIVANRAILAAASCLDNTRKYIIVVGDHIFGQMDAVGIPMNRTAIRPVCLPIAGDPSDYVGSSQLSVVGWANNNGGGPIRVTVLQKESGNHLIKPIAECRKLYQLRNNNNVSLNDAICVGNGTGDSCSADLGSPLAEYKNGRYFLVGLASTVGHGCSPINKAQLPAVFGRVASIVPWILAHTSAAGSMSNNLEPSAPPVGTPPSRPPPPIVVTRTLPPLPPQTKQPQTQPPIATVDENRVFDLSAPECGITKYMDAASKVSLRIVGGSDAQIHQVPWQVRLLIRGYLCGGTIIHKRAILTAAHCIGTKNLSFYRAVAGDHSRDEIDVGEQTLEIVKVIVHEGYNDHANRNDFALLITAKDISFDSWSIRPACLPSRKSEMYTGLNATISGWGRVGSTISQTPKTLKLSTITVHPKAKCSEAYRSRSWLDPGTVITDEMICASAPKQDTCQGDSGGPMTVLENGRYTLIGVTSFGKACGSEQYPGVYARVGSALEWLEKTLSKHVSKA